MDSAATERDILEQKLHDPTAPPIFLPLEFLKAITSNFSSEQELGRGGYGVVYKGVLRSGKIIAVKKLLEIHLVEDKQFQNEATYLMGIRHQNVVQLVGYCAESRWETTMLPSGRYVMAEIPTRLLCFEYIGNKSLDKHLSDESSGLDWTKRFDIIKGIACGLHFLHENCHIVHLDLKPENILMDATMMPKIADFGFSRLLGTQKSRTIINGKLAGSLGYMAPEYLIQGVVSPKADIFSLGVIIIQIIIGCKDYPQSLAIPYFQHHDENDIRQRIEISLQQFTEKVLERWRKRFEAEQKDISLEIYSQQVKQCITIALKCLDHDLERRPNARSIFQTLSAVKTMNCPASNCKDSPVDQMEAPSPGQCKDESSLPNTGTSKELRSESITKDIRNKETAGEVVDKLASLVLHEARSEPQCAISVTSEECLSVKPQSEASAGKQNDEQSASASSQPQSLSANNELEDTASQISCGQKRELLSAQPLQLCFHLRPEDAMGSCSLHLTNNTDETVVFRILTRNLREYFLGTLCGHVLPRSTHTLPITICKRLDDEIFTLESTIADNRYLRDMEASDPAYNYTSRFFRKAKKEGREVQQVKLSVVLVHKPGNMIVQRDPTWTTSISVHPTETCKCFSNKFLPAWHRIITTHYYDGLVQIWDYRTQQTVNTFQVLRSGETDGYVSAAVFIAQKQWFVAGNSSGYMKVYCYKTMQEVNNFKAHNSGVRSLAIHPNETYVLSASTDNLIKLWNWEKGWECIRTFDTQRETYQVKFNPKDADYFASASWDVIQIWNIGSSSCEFTMSGPQSRVECVDYCTPGDTMYVISGHWDGSVTIWDSQRVPVRTLSGHRNVVRVVCVHPDVPILITGAGDGTVRLWNAITFRLEGILDCGLGPVRAIACLKGSRRIVIGHRYGLAMTEITANNQVLACDS